MDRYSLKATTVKEYIDGFPKDMQKILKQLRTIFKKNLPGAQETISYGIPCYKMDGKYVVYFAGYTNHYSVYPVPKNPQLKKEVSAYQTGKGTLQFDPKEPVPEKLISKIIKGCLADYAIRAKK
jgi:uncharacterized protein YdhG (YjbR/CyaY superfamily)